MSFAAPWFLLAAALVVPVLIAFLVRRRRLRMVVPSTLLWRQAANVRRRNRRFKRLSQLLSLAALLSAVLCLALASARPTSKARGNTVALVIDVSASMGTKHEGPLAEAQRLARRMLAVRAAGDRYVIIAAGAKPERLAGPTTDSETLARGLGVIEPETGSADLCAALELGRQLAGFNGRLLLFSDGGESAGGSLECAQTLRAERVAIEASDRENLGVVAFAARPPVDASNDRERLVSVTVASAGSAPRRARVELASRTVVIATRDLEIASGAVKQLELRVQVPSGELTAKVVASDGRGDALAVDDAAQLDLSTSPPMRVHWIAPPGGDERASFFVANALRASGVSELRKSTPYQPPTDIRASDVVVVMDQAPVSRVPAPTLFIATKSGALPVTVRTEVSGHATQLKAVEANHPVTRGVALDGIAIERAVTIDSPTDGTALVELDGGVVVAAGGTGSDRWIYTGIDPLRSDLVLRVAYPVMIANALSVLGNGSQLQIAKTVPLREVTLAKAPQVEALTVASGTPLPGSPVVWLSILAGLLLLIEAVVWWRTSGAERHPVALLVRGVALACVAFAPFAPARESRSDDLSVVFVVDQSMSVAPSEQERAVQSIREAAVAKPNASYGAVTFAARTELSERVGAPGEPLRSGAISPRASNTPGSDLAAAIRLATAALPEHGARRIVLFSDGRSTNDEVMPEVRRAAQQGVQIDVVPIGDSKREKPVIAALHAHQDQVTKGESAQLTAMLSGPPGETVTIAWTRDGSPVMRTPARNPRHYYWSAPPQEPEVTSVVLDEEGRGAAVLTDPQPDSGLHSYEARITEARLDEKAKDEDPSGARASKLVMVSGNPIALVVTNGALGGGLLADALKQAELEVRTVTSGDELGKDQLRDVDLVILDDSRLEREGEVDTRTGLSRKAQEQLVAFARDGGGVIVTGGAFGFGPDFAGSAISKMLPVQIENQGEMIDPPVAMAILLDRSGSMTIRVGQYTKLQLAVEGALASAEALRPDDRLSIGATDEKTEWYLSLSPTKELPAHRARIRAMDPGGGGIYVYTSLVDGYKMLADAHEAIRHVVLFADTADAEEQTQYGPGSADGKRPRAVDLTSDALKTGITTSVVGIGNASDKDTAFLQELAAAGGGRFYLTSDGTNLRRIFVSETRAVARSNLREESLKLSVHQDHTVLAGIDAAALPPVTGLVQTERRATANTILVTPDGRPALAAWRYGIGNVVAFTSAVSGRWTRAWASSVEAGSLMRQIARFAARKRTNGKVDARLRVGASAELEVEVPDDPEAPVPAYAELSVHGNQEGIRPSTIKVQLTQVAPQRYRASASVPSGADVFVRVFDKDGTAMREAVGQRVGESELTGLGPDVTSLRAIASAGKGKLSPNASEMQRPANGYEPRWTPTWPWFLLSASLLTCADLFARRLRRRRDPGALALGVGEATSAGTTGT
jgi:Mg-chelatase subunit ChlD/uncharacterized membrane protein